MAHRCFAEQQAAHKCRLCAPLSVQSFWGETRAQVGRAERQVRPQHISGRCTSPLPRTPAGTAMRTAGTQSCAMRKSFDRVKPMEAIYVD